MAWTTRVNSRSSSPALAAGTTSTSAIWPVVTAPDFPAKSIPELIADLSRYYHLQPGDLIYTGTPAGVGAVRPGDVLEARVEGLSPLTLTIGPAE